MTTQSPIFAAISPGTREFGVAVFRGFDLIYFAVKTFRHTTSANHLKKEVIIFWQKFFAHYNPGILALKEINQYQQTSQTLPMVANIFKTQAEKNGVLAVKISLAQIRSLVLGSNGKITQKRIFQRVALLYPELAQFQNRPSKDQTAYYAYIFSAVAAGLVCLNDLAQKTDNFK